MHLAGRFEYIDSLLDVSNILLLQEHWLFESGFSILENKYKNVSICDVSAMKEDEQLAGRPYGGCVILWKKPIKMLCYSHYM